YRHPLGRDPYRAIERRIVDLYRDEDAVPSDRRNRQHGAAALHVEPRRLADGTCPWPEPCVVDGKPLGAVDVDLDGAAGARVGTLLDARVRSEERRGGED